MERTPVACVLNRTSAYVCQSVLEHGDEVHDADASFRQPLGMAAMAGRLAL
jgi:hypothetical protein